MQTWKVRPVREDEFEPWTRLFRGYADFYHWPTSDEHQRQIWGWIHDDRSVEALVAVPVDEAGIEIRRAARPGSPPRMGAPATRCDRRLSRRPVRRSRARRGTGAVEALFAEINRLALERNWAVIRWTTADDNYRARAVYDKREPARRGSPTT